MSDLIKDFLEKSNIAMAEATAVMKKAGEAINYIAPKAKSYDNLVQHMKDCGWSVHDESGMIYNGNRSYDNWESAIMLCIEVASL